MAPDYAVVVLVLVGVAVGLVTAAYFARRISLVSIDDGDGAHARLINHEHKLGGGEEVATMSVPEIAHAVAEGANAFLYAEYRWMGVFMAVFGLVLLILLGAVTKRWGDAALTTVAFFAGVVTSVTCGFIGMVGPSAQSARKRSLSADCSRLLRRSLTYFSIVLPCSFFLTSLSARCRVHQRSHCSPG